MQVPTLLIDQVGQINKILFMKKIILLLIITFLVSCNKPQRITEITLVDESSIKSGRQFWNGAADCSARVVLYKGDKGITVEVNVKDDILSEQPGKWESDAVELFFDFRPLRLKKTNIYQKGVFQLLIEPGLITHKDRVTYFPSSFPTEVPGTNIQTKRKKNGYNIIVFMPYQGLQEVHYLPRSAFYFDVSLIDIDSSKENTRMVWHGNEMNWSNPQNFGLIKWEAK